MPHVHHTLKQDLTRTILLWGSSFFALLAILFLISFQTLEGHILELMADRRLSYQAVEFDKHLKDRDIQTIIEESEVLVQDNMFAAILLTDGKGRTLSSSIGSNLESLSGIKGPLSAIAAREISLSESSLHLFIRPLTNQKNNIFLVMDGRPIESAMIKATVLMTLLLAILLLLSIKALHYSLRRQLVEPVEHLRKAIENSSIDESTLHRLEEALPDEASEILKVFEELKYSSDEMKTHIMGMMETLPACFWWSHDGKSYTGVSGKASSVLNRSPDDMQGAILWDWTASPPQISSNHLQLQQAIKRQDDKLDYAYQIQTDDTPFWYGESIAICYHKDGTLDTVYGIINDISARKLRQHEQAERLEMTNRMEATATLVAGIAHEFNNALAGMNGNLFLIKQGTDNEKKLNHINRIEQLIQRSATMIDHMLIFACKSTRRPGPVKLIEFLNSFQTSILPELQDRTQCDLSFAQACLSCPPVVLADQKRLHEVLLQLFRNAEFATKDAPLPRISISVDCFHAEETLLRSHPHLTSREIVHIQIRDNGCGIPETIQERIFEPFFTTREVGNGTGLGLSMVYGYLNQIGGAIDVDSSVGTGSTFHIYLPRSVIELKPEKKEHLLQGHGETILAVDDDQMFLDASHEVLERMGYKVIVANNGRQATELYEQHKADIQLILMDILMPGLTGIQTSRFIRRITPDIPIIFLTAYDRTQPMEAEVYQKNAQLLNKPFSIPALSQAIHQEMQPMPENR